MKSSDENRLHRRRKKKKRELGQVQGGGLDQVHAGHGQGWPGIKHAPTTRMMWVIWMYQDGHNNGSAGWDVCGVWAVDCRKWDWMDVCACSMHAMQDW